MFRNRKQQKIIVLKIVYYKKKYIYFIVIKKNLYFSTICCTKAISKISTTKMHKTLCTIPLESFFLITWNRSKINWFSPQDLLDFRSQ